MLRMMLDFTGALALAFVCFASGFSIGFFYLKHKFESHVGAVFDFDSGDFSDLAEEFEIEGDEVEN